MMTDLIERLRKEQGRLQRVYDAGHESVTRRRAIKYRLKMMRELADRLGERGCKTCPRDVGDCEKEIERLTFVVSLKQGVIDDLNNELSACKLAYGKQCKEIERLTVEHGEMNEANVRYEKQIESLTTEVANKDDRIEFLNGVIESRTAIITGQNNAMLKASTALETKDREIDRLQACFDQRNDALIRQTAEGSVAYELLREWIKSEWMVSHDWGGDRDSLLHRTHLLVDPEYDGSYAEDTVSGSPKREPWCEICKCKHSPDCEVHHHLMSDGRCTCYDGHDSNGN